jgi:predicted ATPase
VTLFAQAAGRVQPGFSLSGQTQGDVMCICRLVEGMPLALELAAAWVRTLTCAEIAQEIEQNLGFLGGSGRHAPRRHHSMPAVFDPSWKLLSAAEKRVFQQLSVFHGGFGREAAEQVAGASLPLLAGLADKSLLRRQPGERCDLHELVRQYATAKLQETPPEQAAVQARHGRYYLEFLARQTQPLQGSQRKQAVAEMRAEIDNIRTAWQWAMAHQQAGEMGQAAESLWVFYDAQGWFHEA